MVATRARVDDWPAPPDGAILQRCLRDLVALSSLPTIWIKADAAQIAEGLAQLTVSILDADCAYVQLCDPTMEVRYCHDRISNNDFETDFLRSSRRPNESFELVHPVHGRVRVICLPIGVEPGELLMAVSRRRDFPTDTEKMLLLVAAQQATVSLQRWRMEQRLLDQAGRREASAQINASLFRLTDRLYRAQELADVHAAALDAICETLACRRASILLFDQQGVMRFVAWRNLSEDYRRAVEGHSPWTPDEVRPEPISLDDVASANLPENLARTVLAEGIRALAFIPVVIDGRLAGKFMCYHDRPHSFSRSDVDAALAIARQLGFAIERRRAEEARNLLVGELSHRVKNTLAVVMSIANQSFAGATSIEQAKVSLGGRIHALARSHTQLADTSWTGVSLRTLLLDELAPYQRSDGNIVVHGGEIRLNAKAGVMLGMAFHELATNAAKYGGLSTPHGHVKVSWLVEDGRLAINWEEEDGPSVALPSRSGFGRLLLERLLGADLAGEVSMRFAPSGLQCRMTLPANRCLACT